MESSATKDTKGLSWLEETRLMEALFPYASTQCINEAVMTTESVEETIFRLNDSINPDLYSASHLLKMTQKQMASTRMTWEKAAAAATTTTPSSDPGMMVVDGCGNEMNHTVKDPLAHVQSHLLSRLALFDEDANSWEANQQHEYNATVAVFPIDTAAWDDHFITSATLADVMGAQPLVLPTSAETAFLRTNDAEGSGDGIQAPIIRWAPTTLSLKEEREAKNMILSDEEISSSLCVLHSEEGKDDANAQGKNGMGAKKRTPIVDLADNSPVRVGHVLQTPLQFSIQKECELKKIMDELEMKGGKAFCKMERRNFCKEIMERCKTFTDLLPEYFPKLLRVIGKEMEGKELLPALQNTCLKVFGNTLTNIEAVRVREVTFGRSYACFSDNGEYILWRVKLKHLALGPASFTLAKAGGRGDARKGTASAKAKDIKLKAKLMLWLLSTGHLKATCYDTHVSIGSLHTKCSVFRLNAAGFLFRSLLKQKLSLYLREMLREGINLDLA
ncbi:hypothetical protein TraAM80_08224 [Trypanosoma rangeli]|uniref:Uncharacterized protein n=1 Tax=Trypanosoma rangeli TaxID=5698 RepID=A0A3R7MB64_TRYRA|nr:uncharacterized protein TraAM80_08224 [Trypanosoma rangeli]RNE99433.1 hypothetical protein TraAM80_08224 [Trypanosoma rangeli]|eukprot:RNE99433.1 hypothetical protein TraAM80_08224 [Trypanosoma rangeli]